ncbi:MAG: YkgJ family cysteine cluster protein [Desulfovibrionaceae bacterium]|jgi:Fe-S-cluster containining protein|nr:YkgJ family cysteine cluster protein [Desulfovibrionaceae bacterium]
MALDFSAYFENYEKLLAEVDAVFARVQRDHPECVACQPACSDCCYALFDLTLVEALYLNHHFNERHQGMDRSRILERADQADRESYRIKKALFHASEEGRPSSEILAEVARLRLRCPLLGEDDTCELYEHRPVTCRLYGIPTAIGGEAHTCGKSGFEPGGRYPTVNIEVLQDRLMAMSHELAADLDTRYTDLGSMLVPVSMALMNTYDEEYLGVQAAQPAPDAEAGTIVLDGRGGVGFEESPCASCASKGSGCTPDSCDCAGHKDGTQ